MPWCRCSLPREGVFREKEEPDSSRSEFVVDHYPTEELVGRDFLGAIHLGRPEHTLVTGLGLDIPAVGDRIAEPQADAHVLEAGIRAVAVVQRRRVFPPERSYSGAVR